jgi:proline iminopeptidase
MANMELFPDIEPYDHGMLDVGDGQKVYWEACGNSGGKPALVLHGGPGSGCNTGMRRYFNPKTYMVVLHDQRGGGRSQPRVDEVTDLSTNTTHHLISDIERLRAHLGVDRWVVWGMSWGVTLALSYAERYPERVAAMALTSVTMTRPADVHWLYHETGRYFPEEWSRFRAGVPVAERDGNLVAAYNHLLNVQPDVALRRQAARDWCSWEDAVMSLEEGWVPSRRFGDAAFRITFARIVTHYFHHGAWLEDGEILQRAHRLSGIPGILVHGRLDLGGPFDVAWQLAEVWPDAKIAAVGSGHAPRAEMNARLLEATEAFSRTP